MSETPSFPSLLCSPPGNSSTSCCDHWFTTATTPLALPAATAAKQAA